MSTQSIDRIIKAGSYLKVLKSKTNQDTETAAAANLILDRIENELHRSSLTDVLNCAEDFCNIEIERLGEGNPAGHIFHDLLPQRLNFLRSDPTRKERPIELRYPEQTDNFHQGGDLCLTPKHRQGGASEGSHRRSNRRRPRIQQELNYLPINHHKAEEGNQPEQKPRRTTQ